MPRTAKKRPGRPYLTVRDIPSDFFLYYDAYRYGFLNKENFGYLMGMSKFRIEHYLSICKIKEPVVSCKENEERRKELGIEKDDIVKLSDFYCTLKKEHGEYVDENKAFFNALGLSQRWERAKKVQLKKAKERAAETAKAENTEIE